MILKLIAVSGAIYAAYMSQTRGTWLAIPFFLILACYGLFENVKPGKKLLIAGALILILSSLWGLSQSTHSRILSLETETDQYFKSGFTADTSIGARLEMWRTAFLLYREHPVTGVGREHFRISVQELAAREMVNPIIGRYAHSHNEIFYNMATLGSAGLMAILALYLVPAIYFFRDTRHADRSIRAVAMMGVFLCLGFFIQGLSDVMFMWGSCDNFYAIISAMLFAYIIRRKAGLRDEPASIQKNTAPI
ncbi:O-antigen ligase family protein [Herbaspirillum sp. RTI4]|nr:O-antigen ligase family protein [Herbaspirillum sp. RTI4]MDY7580020.1 O-antigen ligase family protein [Herbaspirillum sp. RTI4]